MTRDVAASRPQEVVDVLGRIGHDVERLVDLHGQLLRSEIRDGIRQVPSALASLGAGAGLVATGGVLGSLMIVHGLHRATRIPLWGCYGVVGGLMAALGVGLLSSGTRHVVRLGLVPRETITALQEDARWLLNQMAPPPTR